MTGKSLLEIRWLQSFGVPYNKKNLENIVI